MNEQRLAELEAAWPLDIPVPPNLPVAMKATVVIHELIAEIRRLMNEVHLLDEDNSVTPQQNRMGRWTKRG